MKLNSISGLVFYVDDLDKTIKFYETLGFRIGKRTEQIATCYVNWFWIDFVSAPKEDKTEFQKEAHAEQKGAGQFLYVKVDNVDEYYKGVLELGLEPSGEPKDWPWGRREFVLRDPDGYKLVFFEKIS